MERDDASTSEAKNNKNTKKAAANWVHDGFEMVLFAALARSS